MRGAVSPTRYVSDISLGVPVGGNSLAYPCNLPRAIYPLAALPEKVRRRGIHRCSGPLFGRTVLVSAAFSSGPITPVIVALCCCAVLCRPFVKLLGFGLGDAFALALEVRLRYR